MPRRFVIITLTVFVSVVILAIGMILWSKPGWAPSVSVDLLGYTNRAGPYAVLAITNRSPSAITLDTTSLVNYTKTGSGHRITSIDANKFRVVHLSPNEGFVQEFFVFPASQGEWQFEYYATYSSGFLEARRAADRWLRNQLRWIKYPFRLTRWEKFDSEWRPCPP